jgi:hypothetical protein
MTGKLSKKELISLKKAELIDIIMQSLKTGRKEKGVAVKASQFTLKGMKKSK